MHHQPSTTPAPTRDEPGAQANSAPAGVAPAAPAASSPAPAPIKPHDGAIFQRLDLCAAFPYTAKYYAKRLSWKLVQSTLFRFSPRRANGWRRFLLRSFGAKLHRTVIIKPSVKILVPWVLEMGAHSCLADGVETWGPGSIKIGRHTVLSRDVFLCCGTHDYTKADLPQLTLSLEIGSGVWVGAQAWIGGGLNGVTLGDNCVIGARAVVNASIKPNMIAAGNPAKAFMVRPMEWNPDLMNAPEHL